MFDAPASATTLAPPPLDPSEIGRVAHTRLRRRMLYEQHDQDVVERVTLAMGAIRASVHGKPDLSANVFLSVWSQVMVLYHQHPTDYPPAGSEAVPRAMSDAGYWPMMQRVARDVGGLREMLVRFDVDMTANGGLGAILPRPVFPDMVELRPSLADPSVPDGLVEVIDDPIHGWTRHHLDVRDPANPSYRVTLAKDGTDITAAVLGDTIAASGWPSVYRDATGAPFLPYVIYHAAKTGFLFDAWAMRGVVEGSLNIAVLLSFYQHLVRNASWPQRWLMGCAPAGSESVDTGTQDQDVSPVGNVARRELVTDPATVVLLQPMEGAASPQVGQWANASDPEAILRSVMAYIRHVYSMAGIQSPDVSRADSAPTSGYSLVVSRESIRDEQRVYEPQFRAADQQAHAMVACILNRVRGTTYSEVPGAYAIQYEGLPLSPAEEAAKLAQLEAKVASGQIGPVSAYQEMHPHCPHDEAVIRVATAALERDEVDRMVRTLSGADPDALPVVPLTSQQLQYATQIVTGATANPPTIPVPVARAMLVGLIGVPERQADSILAGVVPAPLPPPPVT